MLMEILGEEVFGQWGHVSGRLWIRKSESRNHYQYGCFSRTPQNDEVYAPRTEFADREA
jgi:hypothetical protein